MIWDLLFSLIMVVLNVYLGGFFIGCAVDNFRSGKNFYFGLDIMMAIASILILASIFMPN